MNDFPEQFIPENQNPWYGPAHGQFGQAHLPRAGAERPGWLGEELDTPAFPR
jgi:hypothetical protein